MKRIDVSIIDHKDQNYNTPGNYWYDGDGVLRIEVSDLGNDELSELVAIHELVEELLTRVNGIPEKKITAFDLQYEKEREQGLHSEEDEPGFDRKSPYWHQHQIATAIEMLLCEGIGVNWGEYTALFQKLPKWEKK